MSVRFTATTPQAPAPEQVEIDRIASLPTAEIDLKRLARLLTLVDTPVDISKRRTLALETLIQGYKAVDKSHEVCGKQA